MDTQGGNRLLTAKIVGSYLRHNKVAASQVPELIAIVHRSLGELGQQPPAEETLTPAVSVRQSVRRDYVVCLECGYRAQMLRRHISSRHGLSRAEYLSRWGLKSDHPLTAPAYSEHRSTLAKQLGLGRKPNAGVTPAAAERSEPSGDEKADADHASPKRTTASGSDEAVSQTKRTRQSRSRSRSAARQSDPLATPSAEA